MNICIYKYPFYAYYYIIIEHSKKKKKHLFEWNLGIVSQLYIYMPVNIYMVTNEWDATLLFKTYWILTKYLLYLLVLMRFPQETSNN